MVRPDRAFRFVSAAFLAGDCLGEIAAWLGLTGQRDGYPRLVDPHCRAADDELPLAGLAGCGPLTERFMRALAKATAVGYGAIGATHQEVAVNGILKQNEPAPKQGTAGP